MGAVKWSGCTKRGSGDDMSATGNGTDDGVVTTALKISIKSAYLFCGEYSTANIWMANDVLCFDTHLNKPGGA